MSPRASAILVILSGVVAASMLRQHAEPGSATARGEKAGALVKYPGEKFAMWERNLQQEVHAFNSSDIGWSSNVDGSRFTTGISGVSRPAHVANRAELASNHRWTVMDDENDSKSSDGWKTADDEYGSRNGRESEPRYDGSDSKSSDGWKTDEDENGSRKRRNSEPRYNGSDSKSSNGWKTDEDENGSRKRRNSEPRYNGSDSKSSNGWKGSDSGHDSSSSVDSRRVEAGYGPSISGGSDVGRGSWGAGGGVWDPGTVGGPGSSGLAPPAPVPSNIGGAYTGQATGYRGAAEFAPAISAYQRTPAAQPYTGLAPQTHRAPQATTPYYGSRATRAYYAPQATTALGTVSAQRGAVTTPTYRSYRPAATAQQPPQVVFRPSVAPSNVEIGRSIWGTEKLYKPDQPVLNLLRSLAL